MVPKADTDTEIASLVSGESDFIFPQAYAGITDALNDPNIKYDPGLRHQLRRPVLPARCRLHARRDPFVRVQGRRLPSRRSPSRSTATCIRDNIYDPIFPGGPLLNCGVWVPTIGPWCDNIFGKADGKDGYYDPTGAEKILTDAGWTKDGSGMWAKDGNVPEIHWVINSGNTRRESTQALLIPEMKAAGFNIIADNCDAACYFQQRLPALKYDLAMYIQTAALTRRSRASWPAPRSRPRPTATRARTRPVGATRTPRR